MLKHVIVLSLLICCCGSVKSGLLNPSFEELHEGLSPLGYNTAIDQQMALPDDWNWRKQGEMEGLAVSQIWRSDGLWSLYLFAANTGDHFEGDYVEYYQAIDLTNIEKILFDVEIPRVKYSTRSYVAIDSQKLWQANVQQTKYNLEIDVSQFMGTHELVLGVEVYQGFASVADNFTKFDNIRLVEIPEPATLTLFVLGALLATRKRILLKSIRDLPASIGRCRG